MVCISCFKYSLHKMIFSFILIVLCFAFVLYHLFYALFPYSHNWHLLSRYSLLFGRGTLGFKNVLCFFDKISLVFWNIIWFLCVTFVNNIYVLFFFSHLSYQGKKYERLLFSYILMHGIASDWSVRNFPSTLHMTVCCKSVLSLVRVIVALKTVIYS